MNLFTEKEFNNQSQHFAFKLRNLYLKSKEEFCQIQDYLQFPIYVNDRQTIKYHYFSNTFFSKGKEIENLYTTGLPYLKKISHPFLLEKSLKKAKTFDLLNDYNSVCNYLQSISLNGRMTSFFTNKILIDDKLTLNTTLFSTDSVFAEKIFKELIPSGEENLNKWLRFQTLTKREKQILKLLANDYSNKEISDLLFLSSHSIKTHRRNIYRKLDIHKTSQLVRIAIAMELLEN